MNLSSEPAEYFEYTKYGCGNLFFVMIKLKVECY